MAAALSAQGVGPAPSEPTPAPQAPTEAPAAVQSPGTQPVAPTGAPAASAGSVTFGPQYGGSIAVQTRDGQPVAAVTLRAGQTTVLPLPAGDYVVTDAAGTRLVELSVAPGDSVIAALPASMVAPASPPPPAAPVPTAAPAVATADAGPPVQSGAQAQAVPPPPQDPKRPRWKRWATPLFSAITPGVGQMVNRQAGKGVGILLGSLGALLTSAALYVVQDPTEGATPGAGGRSDGAEIGRLTALQILTGGLQMLYAWNIMDAHAVAAGKGKPTPRTKHKIRLELMRSATIGFRPNQPAYDTYNDWTFSVLGQPVPRLSVGVTDMGLKLQGGRDRSTIQAGVRLGYRVLDRGRVWLSLALGSIFQGTWADKQALGFPDESDGQGIDAAFGAIPYGQFEAKIFILDRWSLNLVPRVSVPLTNRYYSRGKVLPRYATTFELGTGVGVYF